MSVVDARGSDAVGAGDMLPFAPSGPISPRCLGGAS